MNEKKISAFKINIRNICLSNSNFNTSCLRNTPEGLCEGRMTELA